jgi:hypothetical protein
MAEIIIDRLALEVPTMPEAEAQSLALAIASQLAVASPAGGDGEVRALRVNLTAKADSPPSLLAAGIVSEILRQLQRSP